MTGVTGVHSVEHPHGISRRAMLAGAAWAAPVVVVATAAPAAAASCTLTFSVNAQNSCVTRGGLYYLQLCVTATGCTFTAPADIRVDVLGENGRPAGDAYISLDTGTTQACGFPQSALVIAPVPVGVTPITYAINDGPAQRSTLTLPPITTLCPFG